MKPTPENLATLERQYELARKNLDELKNHCDELWNAIQSMRPKLAPAKLKPHIGKVVKFTSCDVTCLGILDREVKLTAIRGKYAYVDLGDEPFGKLKGEVRCPAAWLQPVEVTT